MKTHLFILLFLAVTVMYSGCRKEQPPEKPLHSWIVKHSDCKAFPPDSAIELSNKSCVEYIYNDSEKELFLRHLSAGFNCCPGNLYYVAEYSGDTLVIQAFESEAGCFCLCLYDLDIRVTGVDKYTTYIKIIEPYSHDQDKLYFKVNFSVESMGEYCADRTQYPWGVPDFGSEDQVN
jgi:hypothetical protein